MTTYKSFSSAETKSLASELARRVLREKSRVRGAFVVALHGDLGSGKTTFTQGFASELGVKKRITSPTFILMQRHGLRGQQFRNLYHIDCYRIKKAKEFLAIGLREILADPKNIVLIEWPEKIKAILPKSAIKISFAHSKRQNERIIKIYP